MKTKLLTSVEPDLAQLQGALGPKKHARASKRLLVAQIEGRHFGSSLGIFLGFFFFSPLSLSLSFLTIFLSQKTQKHIKLLDSSLFSKNTK